MDLAHFSLRDCSVRIKLVVAFSALAVLIAATGSAGLWLTKSTAERAKRIGEEHLPNSRAAIEVQVAITQAHLVFEEIMAGDKTETLDEVWRLLDKAKWLSTAIISGGENDSGRYLATNSPEVRRQMETVIPRIDEFRLAAEKRLALNSKGSAAGSTIEIGFDKSYEATILAIDAVISEAHSPSTPETVVMLGNAAQAKYLIANAHLFLEEVIAGDATESYEEVKNDFNSARDLLSALNATPAKEKSLAAVSALDSLVRLADQRFAALDSGQAGGAVETAFDETYEKLISSVSEAEAVVRRESAAAVGETQQFESIALYLLVAITISGFILAGLLAVVIGRNIARRIGALCNEMKSLAAGNLAVHVSSANDRDEVGHMAKALRFFQQALAEKAVIEHERAEQTRIAQEIENAFQDELRSVLEAISSGDFSRKLSLSSDSSLSRKVGEGMNKVIDVVDQAIRSIASVITALASGDLGQRIEGDFKGSFLALKTGTNAMAGQMQSIAEGIVVTARAVQDATREITAGVVDLSSRTEQQASSLEETTASMEEISATVRQNASNALEASKAAYSTRELASSGGEITAKAVDAMGKIEASSSRITEMVDLIEDIAFQTNILALNAAVEAARAGEAGKGFSVVANEVRALSQRAAQALKDIKDIITTSAADVAEGSSLVKEAGGSLGEIVVSVKRMSDFVSEIACASQQQSSGIDQVNLAVANMDQMTQQNAALVEETNAALLSVKSQVDELARMVEFFKVSNSHPAATVRSDLQRTKRAMTTHANSPVPSAMKMPLAKTGTYGAPSSDRTWTEF